MEPFCRLSTSEQLADHLRGQIESGRLRGMMPGVQQLVKALGVNSVAVGKAVQQLEHEGLIIHQGNRRSRKIANQGARRLSSLRIGMLLCDTTDARRSDVLAVKQELMRLGHQVFSCPKSMSELGRDLNRIRRQVAPLDADAWLVFAASGPVLRWFERQPKPTFAIYGRFNEANVAAVATCKAPVIFAVIEKLVALGHRRIVLVTREERRRPELGLLERAFIEGLEQHGIKTGKFNVPDWEDTPEGLRQVIHSLFAATPPTALFVGDATLLHAIQRQLASMGILAPRDVSLFCNDFETSFLWTRPEVSHIQWDHRPVVRRIAKWANHLVDGRQDTRKTLIKTHLYEGGTIGPARQGA